MKEENKSNFKAEHTREHLANERTFLAWVRTSLAVIGLGFIVVKFSMFAAEIGVLDGKTTTREYNATFSLVAGVLLVAIGAAITAFSYANFLKTRRVIQSGSFFQATGLAKTMTILIIAASVVLIAYLFLTT
jgi:putative membrane protein